MLQLWQKHFKALVQAQEKAALPILKDGKLDFVMISNTSPEMILDSRQRAYGSSRAK